jgi:hypothetical protein
MDGQDKSDSGESSDKFGKVFTYLGASFVSIFMGILAIPGKSGSPLIYIHYTYVYIVPFIFGVSGIVLAFYPEKYHKLARWGYRIGLLFIVLPFLISIIISNTL